MAVSYRTIFRQVALRVNAIAGTDVSTVETKYAGASFTSGTDTDSVIFPLTSIKDAIISAEEEIVAVIAGQADHPYRAFFHGTSSSLADGAVLPTADGSSNPVIGVVGAVRDATDSVSLTAQPLSVVKNVKRNSGGFLVSDYYYYCIVGNRIRHTRASVTLDLCVYNAATQATNITASVNTGTAGNNTVLPDALEFMLVAGAISRLVRDDEFAGQAQIYRSYFESAKQSLLNGGTSVPTGPTGLTTTSSAA